MPTIGDAERSGPRHRITDLMRALVIAIACELPAERGLALSRHFASSIWQVAVGEGLRISLRSVQRILKANALKPWRYTSWMHPRDPNFVVKVKVILDLYQFIFEGRSLGPNDHVLCADEKTNIQARLRQVTAPDVPRLVTVVAGSQAKLDAGDKQLVEERQRHR